MNKYFPVGIFNEDINDYVPKWVEAARVKYVEKDEKNGGCIIFLNNGAKLVCGQEKKAVDKMISDCLA